jgi:hypothetical protein
VTAPEISILNHSEASRNYLSFFQNYLFLINQSKINIIATREKTTIPGAVCFFFNAFDSLCLSKREVQPNNMEEFRKKRSNSFLFRGWRIDANVPDVLGNYCLLIEWEFKQLGQSRHGCCKKHRTRNDPDNPKSVQCKEILNRQREENYLSRSLARSPGHAIVAYKAKPQHRQDEEDDDKTLHKYIYCRAPPPIYYLLFTTWFFSYLPGYTSIF